MLIRGSAVKVPASPSQMASADDGDVYYYVDLQVRDRPSCERLFPTNAPNVIPRREMGTSPS